MTVVSDHSLILYYCASGEGGATAISVTFGGFEGKGLDDRSYGCDLCTSGLDA